MNKKHRWHALCAVGLGLGLAALSGCQTNVAGMTLPSGHYLEHPPQYFPPSPAFPLSRELATMEGVVGAAPGEQPVGPQGALPAGPQGPGLPP
jgi:hypothetical protein